MKRAKKIFLHCLLQSNLIGYLIIKQLIDIFTFNIIITLIRLTEMTGRLAWCAYLDGEAGEVTIPTATLSPGAYIVTLSNDRGERIVQKVMIQ